MTPTTTATGTLLRDGIAAAQAGNKVRARFVIRQAVSAEPENEVGWLWLANLAPEPAEAVDCLRKVLDINPNNKHARASLPNVLVRAGAAASQAGDASTARGYLTEAVHLDPKNELGWLWLAGVARDGQEAVRHLTRVLDINPTNDRAKAGLAAYHKEFGNWNCPLCNGLGAGPSGGRCPSCRAVISLDDVRAFDTPTGADETAMGQAIARLAPQAARQPGGPAAFHLALAYLNLGQPAEAIARFNSAALVADADPRWKDGVRRLAEHWRAMNKGAAVESAPDAPPPRLLMVVDDSPTVRKLVAVALEPSGYKVVGVSSGLKIDAALAEHGLPALFILDINMPEIDGFALCKNLKKHKQTAAIPVVFLTGKNGFFDKLRGQWAGAVEYLTKPFQPALLAATVANILEPAAAR